MAVGDIYQVKLTTTLFGEVCNNVFHYQVSAGNNNAADLRLAFSNGVIDPVQAIQPVEVNYTNIQIINGMNNVDQLSQAMAEGGSLIGNVPISTMLAFGFRRRTGGAGYRYSYKRFPGPVTAQIGANGQFAVGTINAMDLVAVALGSALVGLDATYVPVQISGGFQLGVPPVFRQGLTGNWELNIKPTHQDTRQQFAWVPATP